MCCLRRNMRIFSRQMKEKRNEREKIHKKLKKLLQLEHLLVCGLSFTFTRTPVLTLERELSLKLCLAHMGAINGKKKGPLMPCVGVCNERRQKVNKKLMVVNTGGGERARTSSLHFFFCSRTSDRAFCVLFFGATKWMIRYANLITRRRGEQKGSCVKEANTG